jgi:hypothetical protein
VSSVGKGASLGGGATSGYFHRWAVPAECSSAVCVLGWLRPAAELKHDSLLRKVLGVVACPDSQGLPQQRQQTMNSICAAPCCAVLCFVCPCRRVPAQRAGRQQAHIQGTHHSRVSSRHCYTGLCKDWAGQGFGLGMAWVAAAAEVLLQPQLQGLGWTATAATAAAVVQIV